MSAHDTIQQMLARLSEVRTTDHIPAARQPRPQAACHPDAPHYARGLCKPCYEKLIRAERRGEQG